MSICVVTGASGFVAGELIHQLFQKGYTVRGTVRSLSRSAPLQETFPNLILHEADLLKDGSFDDCIKGATYVFHTASPFLTSWVDPQKDLVDPAVNGTLNVLSSIEKNLDTVKKVVITSSAAAILQQHHDQDPNKVWSEEDWNTTSSLTEGPYRYSKYLAEKAAWDWWKGKEDKVKLTVINPCFVLGVPHHKRTESVSINTMVEMLNGKLKEKGCPTACYGMVDIRNVAQAHIACIENENASGRYLLSSALAVPQLEIANILRKHFPDYPLPEKQNGEITYVPRYSQEKTKKLGIEFYPEEDTIVWMAKGIIDLGYLENTA
jgi:nucleoside-diphosphate-sugar epimerase